MPYPANSPFREYILSPQQPSGFTSRKELVFTICDLYTIESKKARVVLRVTDGAGPDMEADWITCLMHCSDNDHRRFYRSSWYDIADARRLWEIVHEHGFDVLTYGCT